MKNKRENIKELEKARYSPKEALVYFTLGYFNTKSNDVDKIVKNVVEQMMIVNKTKVLEKFNSRLLCYILNSWQLSFTEVIAYAYIVFSNLKTINRPINMLHIVNEFNVVMRLYSPSNAEEFVERNDFNIYT